MDHFKQLMSNVDDFMSKLNDFALNLQCEELTESVASNSVRGLSHFHLVKVSVKAAVRSINNVMGRKSIEFFMNLLRLSEFVVVDAEVQWNRFSMRAGLSRLSVKRFWLELCKLDCSSSCCTENTKSIWLMKLDSQPLTFF